MADNLTTPNKPVWCPGCGDFGIWTAFKLAAQKANWNNSNTVFVAGIGCHGHLTDDIKLTSVEGLHGRALPVAAGIKMVNNNLNVLVFTGDGDCLAEGGNHFINTARRNQDISVFIHDNAIYGLTTGQTSPTSPLGYKSKSTPGGNPEEPLNPLLLALSAGATFLARGFSNDIQGLTELMIKANEHRGFAVVQILQPCITFNKVYTAAFFQQNTYKLGASYNPTNKLTAFEKLHEWGEKQIPLGIFYQIKETTFEERLPQINKMPIVKQNASGRNLQGLYKTFL